MTKSSKVKPLPDHETYVKNRSRHSLDELARYGDQWVAWSADGTTVVAHHKDPLEVTAMVLAAGVDSEEVHLEWIPPDSEVDVYL
jgi:hypothetical protein